MRGIGGLLSNVSAPIEWVADDARGEETTPKPGNCEEAATSTITAMPDMESGSATAMFTNGFRHPPVTKGSEVFGSVSLRGRLQRQDSRPSLDSDRVTGILRG